MLHFDENNNEPILEILMHALTPHFFCICMSPNLESKLC